jgi:hypothetical protein
MRQCVGWGCRRSGCTIYAMVGHPLRCRLVSIPKVAEERLGHANIGIRLDTYSHVVAGGRTRTQRSRLQRCFAVALAEIT